jgi:hypothetical protein
MIPDGTNAGANFKKAPEDVQKLITEAPVSGAI